MPVSFVCSVPAADQAVKQAEMQPPAIFAAEELDQIEAMIRRAG